MGKYEKRIFLFFLLELPVVLKHGKSERTYV